MLRRSLFSRLGLLGGSSLFAAVLGGLSKRKPQAGANAEVFGAVRLLTTGPEILDDANHTPQGLTGAFINAKGFLEVTHTDLVVVGLSAVTPDETLVSRGIMVGNSQGFTSGRLTFYDTTKNTVLNLNTAAHYTAVAGANCNIWFYARGNSQPS